MPKSLPLLPVRLAVVSVLAVAAATQDLAKADAAGPATQAKGAENPFKLEPFEAGFPVELEYPPRSGAEYVRTRRQILERIAANLQGARKETWLFATEFYWRAPEDAVEPLIEAMDRALGRGGLDDMVRNCIEAMARMATPEFDAALRRALYHKNPAVQQAAFTALGPCGKPETLRELASAFVHMDGRARAAWLQAVRERLGKEGIALLTSVMNGNYPIAVRDQALMEALKLPPADAAEVLRGRWESAVGEFKAIIAGVLHAAGDASGTVWLRETLAGEDLLAVGHALRHCVFAGADPGPLREVLLKLSTHLRPEVRCELAKTLTKVSGDDVADVFEVLAAPDEPWDTRGIAIRELTKRGRGGVVSALLTELPTATGSRLDSIIQQLSASGDPRAVPVIAERLAKAPEGMGRPFVQALAANQSAAAAKALFDAYVGPVKVLGRGSSRNELTTRNYLPTLFLNLRGSERVILEAFLALPKSEWRLRAPLLPTLAGYAADRSDKALQADCIAPLRAILFDRDELPQMRVLALNQLTRRWLTIEDALALKNGHRDESPGLRAVFGDFLLETF